MTFSSSDDEVVNMDEVKPKAEYGVSYIGGDPCGSRYNDDPFDASESIDKPGMPEDMKERIRLLAEKYKKKKKKEEITSDIADDITRRCVAEKSAISAAGLISWAAAPFGPAFAASPFPKSRTNGYAVQKSEEEWASLLSVSQYNILRRGGTERQRSSILDLENRRGIYVCAGCGTPLFEDSAKFKSGTGWPSFASALGTAVEQVSNDSYSEARCANCGGHLGDVFSDGWRYFGTPAAKTGRRFCIDGAALVFRPDGAGKDVMGDRLPANKVISYEQPMYRDRPVS